MFVGAEYVQRSRGLGVIFEFNIYLGNEWMFIQHLRTFAHGAMGRRIDPSWWTH